MARLVQVRAELVAPTVEPMAAATAGLLEEPGAFGEPGGCGIVRRVMAPATARLDVLQRDHRLLPEGDIAVCRLGARRAALALVADRAAEALERVHVVVGMVGEGRFGSRIGRVVDGKVARGAPVHGAQLGNDDLPQLQGQGLGSASLVDRGCPSGLELAEGLLMAPPFPALLLEESDDHEHDQDGSECGKETERQRGRVGTRVAGIHFPSLRARQPPARARPNPSWGLGSRSRSR